MCDAVETRLAGWRGRTRTTESVRTEIRLSCRENFARAGQNHVQRPFQCEMRVRESSTAVRAFGRSYHRTGRTASSFKHCDAPWSTIPIYWSQPSKVVNLMDRLRRSVGRTWWRRGTKASGIPAMPLREFFQRNNNVTKQPSSLISNAVSWLGIVCSRSARTSGSSVCSARSA